MPSICNYPLRFQPLLRRYLWGGRRLESMLGKSLDEGDDYAESWEIVDHGEDQSVVREGAAAGLTLHELVAGHAADLFGRHADQTQFPLLLKFLDCNRTLSVQVHPNDTQAAKLDPPDLGKTEAWVVLAADPGSKIYAGLKSGVTRDDLRAAIDAGTCDQCLHEFQPTVGDCLFIEAGTVHALGAGLVIAEIQQASDATFRLFDWNRVDAAGNPRQLHVEESLEVADYERGPVLPAKPQASGGGCERLVECNKFVLDRCELTEGRRIGGDDCFHLLAVLDGSAEVASEVLSRGETCIVPAAAGQVDVVPQGRAMLLDITLP